MSLSLIRGQYIYHEPVQSDMALSQARFKRQKHLLFEVSNVIQYRRTFFSTQH